MAKSRRVLAVAVNEAQRYLRALNRKVLLLLIAAGVLATLLLPAIQQRGVYPDEGLYTVELDPQSPLAPAVQGDPTFDALPFEYGLAFSNGRADLFVREAHVAYDWASPRSQSAVEELSRSAERYFDTVLEREPDQAAAFPVRVNLVYEPRGVLTPPTPTAPSPAPPATGTPTSPAVLLVEESPTRQLGLAPSQVNPPFPIRSLLLTFAYLIPLNFLNQFYAGSFLAERTRHRGLLLLSAPLSGPQIVLGKSAPYALLTLAIALVTTGLIGAGPTGFLAILPVLYFSLATTLLFALLARSYRELTFFIVSTNVLLSTFLFLPAVFTEIHPISYLSPITVVAANIRGDSTTALQFLYSTLPLLLASLVVTLLGVALYREEELFAPKKVLSKLVDAIHYVTPRTRHLLAAGALLVPFALGLEVFVLVFAVTLHVSAALTVFLLGTAFVEESLKGLLAYAFAARAHRRTIPWIPGLLIGAGFFLGEKLALLFSLVGLDLLPRGPEVLATYGIATSSLLVALPLLLHVVTSTVLVFAAARGKATVGLAYLSMGGLHAAYNAGVLRFYREVIALSP